MPKQDSQLAVYDFTLSRKFCESRHELLKCLKEWAKHYTFQLEESDNGYVHWQGRMSLIKPRRLGEFKKLIQGLDVIGKMTVSPSSNESLRGECFYTMKADTRIEGPWSEKDQPLYIPRQVRECPNLRPFQQAIIDNIGVWDTRTVNFVYCKSGNNGKSILVSYLRCHGLARCLPPVNDQRDFLRMVCDLPTATMYVVDMPRAMKKEKMLGFYSALETVKDGYAYDDRYTFKEKHFDCPNIWVFGNHMPDVTLMSRDRWKFWTITADYQLEAIEVMG